MTEPSTYLRHQALRQRIDQLEQESLTLEEFEKKVAQLKKEFVDVLGTRGTSGDASLLRDRISWIRAKLRADAAVKSIHERMSAIHVTLAANEVILIRRVIRAFNAVSGGSKLLRTNLKALEDYFASDPALRDASHVPLTDGKFTVGSDNALTLRDALETALVDLAALQAYDAELSRAGDAGRGGYAVGRGVLESILARFEPESERTLLNPAPRRYVQQLQRIFADATANHLSAVDVNAGRLRSLLQGSHRAGTCSICCKAMRVAMLPGDRVVSDPGLSDSELLTIRYRIPRGSDRPKRDR